MSYTHFRGVSTTLNGYAVGKKGEEVPVFTIDATAGINTAALGTVSAPQTLTVNPGAAVIASSVNVQSTLGAGNCDDLIATYEKAAVLGAGDAGITVVGDASRAYVGTDGLNAVAAQAYGTQAWAKHDGTGAITAMSGLSALVDVNTGNFVATTVNAGHFHIEGAATVTGQFDGVMVEAYPDVTSLDSLLALAVDGGAVVGSGIRITGAPSAEITLSNGLKIFSGVSATRAAVQAEAGPGAAPIGSLYLGTAFAATTKPNMYIKQAAAVWERIVTQAAD